MPAAREVTHSTRRPQNIIIQALERGYSLHQIAACFDVGRKKVSSVRDGAHQWLTEDFYRRICNSDLGRFVESPETFDEFDTLRAIYRTGGVVDIQRLPLLHEPVNASGLWDDDEPPAGQCAHASCTAASRPRPEAPSSYVTGLCEDHSKLVDTAPVRTDSGHLAVVR